MLRSLLALLAVALLGQGAAWADAAPSGVGANAPHMKVALVAESQTPAPGKPLTLAVVMTPQPGWHGYWVNPGEAGFAPDLKWTLPQGVSVGTIRYPVPEKLVISGLVNHVFEAEHALLTMAQIPADMKLGTSLPISLTINYLVCSDQICVPETSVQHIALTAGDGAPDAALAAKFDQWRAALPRPLGAQATYQLDQGHIRWSIPYPASAPLVNPWLFVVPSGIVRSAGMQHITRDGDHLIIDSEAGATAPSGSPPALLSTGAHQGLMFDAVAGVVAKPGNIDWLTILAALGGALLGGLILNLMPCVFPVIGLKAISLAKGGGDERAVRRDALAYSAGVIVVCLALGGALLALRAAGHEVGWAFQLQDPRVILLLLVLVIAITANLAGLFELQSVSAGDDLTRQHGLAGSFWTGALAAFVATPCTGPFMAAALGAALVLPVFAALMIFAGLGLGLALPFLALGFIPALRTKLPKPGAWMRTFQQIMAIPMALTALGLLWLLWRQAGLEGLLIGAGVGVLGVLALWLIGKNQRDGIAIGMRGLAQLLVPALVGIVLLAQVQRPIATTEAGLLNAQPFSEAKLAAAQAAHQPVFVYFTADWCLTCKVNERAAIETQTVADAFKAHNVVVLEGDWTNGDAAISHFLTTHGRSGVPYYLFYPADGSAPKELPQVLTPGSLTALVQ